MSSASRSLNQPMEVPRVILNFHGVGPLPRGVAVAEAGFWLERDRFEAVLDLAQEHTHVRLTFDDGNVSDVELALPALLRRGLKATFFVCSGRLNQAAFLSAAQIRDLRRHGMGMGSHGAAHRSWRHMAPAHLLDELEGSRRVLEAVCGVPIDAAACPFGAYDRAVLAAVRRAGYRVLYTSDGGAAPASHWLQPRTTVTRSMSLASIQRLVQHGPSSWQQCSVDVRKLFKRLR